MNKNICNNNISSKINKLLLNYENNIIKRHRKMTLKLKKNKIRRKCILFYINISKLYIIFIKKHM